MVGYLSFCLRLKFWPVILSSLTFYETVHNSSLPHSYTRLSQPYLRCLLQPNQVLSLTPDFCSFFAELNPSYLRNQAGRHKIISTELPLQHYYPKIHQMLYSLLYLTSWFLSTFSEAFLKVYIIALGYLAPGTLSFQVINQYSPQSDLHSKKIKLLLNYWMLFLTNEVLISMVGYSTLIYLGFLKTSLFKLKNTIFDLSNSSF